MRGQDIVDIGYTQGPAIGLGLQLFSDYGNKKKTLTVLKRILRKPEKFVNDSHPIVKSIATALVPQDNPMITLLEEERPFKIYGIEDIEKGAIDQLSNASRLPITVQGALMPDAHQGYGLPIGGVLATDNAVIPYGVGVDIGCRMCLTIYGEDETYFKRNQSALKKSLIEHTAFGTGIGPKVAWDDEVLENPLFNEIQLVKGLKDTAANQIGSSGGGNHFVEWGIADFFDPCLGLEGRYLAILTHSGSRGLGANIANHYTKIAKEKCKLPKGIEHLAYLDLNSEEGQEYWLAMNLAGDYASACHDHIHRKLAKSLGLTEMYRIENHHNFAWKEQLNGKDVIVHRKGATPAGKGVLGIIPASMLEAGYIVMGKGDELSINSASHGAGRVMSRTQGNNTFTMGGIKKQLKSNGIELIGGGPDEAPGVYKNIEKVMSNQVSLVDVLGRFYPKIVRMADKE